MVPGAWGDTSGARPGPDPGWKRTATPPLPHPLPLAVCPVRTEATRAHRQPHQPHSPAALPPQRAAVNQQAAGLDVGAEALDVAVPPTDAPQPVRGVGASTVA